MSNNKSKGGDLHHMKVIKPEPPKKGSRQYTQMKKDRKKYFIDLHKKEVKEAKYKEDCLKVFFNWAKNQNNKDITDNVNIENKTNKRIYINRG